MYMNREKYVKELLQGLRSNIRYYRALSGVDCEQLAERAAIDPGYLSRLESDGSKTVPSLHTLLSIAYCLGINIADLLAQPAKA